MAQKRSRLVNIVTKAIETLTGSKVNATAKDVEEAVKKARARIDAERFAKEAEERKLEKASKEG